MLKSTKTKLQYKCLKYIYVIDVYTRNAVTHLSKNKHKLSSKIE